MIFTFSEDGLTKTCDGCGAKMDAGSGHICDPSIALAAKKASEPEVKDEK